MTDIDLRTQLKLVFDQLSFVMTYAENPSFKLSKPYLNYLKSVCEVIIKLCDYELNYNKELKE